MMDDGHSAHWDPSFPCAKIQTNPKQPIQLKGQKKLCLPLTPSNSVAFQPTSLTPVSRHARSSSRHARHGTAIFANIGLVSGVYVGALSLYIFMSYMECLGDVVNPGEQHATTKYPQTKHDY